MTLATDFAAVGIATCGETWTSSQIADNTPAPLTP